MKVPTAANDPADASGPPCTRREYLSSLVVEHDRRTHTLRRRHNVDNRARVPTEIRSVGRTASEAIIPSAANCAASCLVVASPDQVLEQPRDCRSRALVPSCSLGGNGLLCQGEWRSTNVREEGKSERSA